MERSEELRSVLPFLPIMTMRYWSRIWPYLSCFLTLSHLFPSIKISFWKLFYFKTLKNKNTIRSTFIVLKNCFKKSIMSSITEPKWGNFFYLSFRRWGFGFEIALFVENSLSKNPHLDIGGAIVTTARSSIHCLRTESIFLLLYTFSFTFTVLLLVFIFIFLFLLC